MLLIVYLSLLIFQYYPAHAHLSCFHLIEEETHLPILGPSALDCLWVLDHIPQFTDAETILLSNYSDALRGTLKKVFPEHPFYSNSDISHDSCSVLLRYYEGRIPRSLDEMEYAESFGLPRSPLAEESVLKLWDAQREAAQQVAATCVHQGHAGIQWEPIDLPDVPFAWYAALVTQFSRSARQTRMEQRAALAGHAIGPLSDRKWDYMVGDYDV